MTVKQKVACEGWGVLFGCAKASQIPPSVVGLVHEEAVVAQ